jgi:folate-binding protein YgfZ
MKRLRMYKLRADVEVTDRRADFTVMAFWGDNVANRGGLENTPGAAKTLSGGTLYVDPRLSNAGLRAVVPAGSSDIDGIETTVSDNSAYEAHRLSLGLPQSGSDLVIDKSILLESGLDELNAIDWDKGCYMGQEVTARSKYRGLVKKRLMPVEISGTAPEPGSFLMAGDKQAGEMRSVCGSRGMALIRLGYLQDHPAFTCADLPGATITPHKPQWANF